MQIIGVGELIKMVRRLSQYAAMEFPTCRVIPVDIIAGAP